VLDSHILKPENVLVRQKLKKLDLAKGSNRELGFVSVALSVGWYRDIRHPSHDA
jgi:hypothetical protein